jgi:Arc/MetJ family transcription regulator
MRTTVELDDDVARAVDELRRTRSMGVSEAVNELIRRGLLARPPERPFAPIHRDLGLTIDVSNVADALDLLEGPEAR